MNSRWQASKIGLVNFWYYDEQEFPLQRDVCSFEAQMVQENRLRCKVLCRFFSMEI